MPFLPVVSDAQTGVRLLGYLETKKPRINTEYFGLVARIASSLFFCIFLFTIPGLAQSHNTNIAYVLSHGKFDGSQDVKSPDQANSENGSPSNSASAGEDAVTCTQILGVPVALEPGQPANYAVSGELCATQDELSAGTTVQLLIHGATYNHDYWDFGTVDRTRYSYARDVAAHGFPALAIDLPGAGNSSHPSSGLLTVQAEAFFVHQVVQALRNGSIAGVEFAKVILVGHSLGSVVVWEEAVNYSDVDGVIVTGAAHSITTRFLTSNAFYPALKDPKFAPSGLDSGYLTTVPGSRFRIFFAAPDVDPAVIGEDEERKDVVSGAELSSGLPIVTSTATAAIKVPVLTILGSDDLTTCGLNPQGIAFDCSTGAAIATQDAPFYSPEAKIHACVIPGSGHDISLAVNHELQVADAVAWANAFVGQRDFAGRASFAGGTRGLSWNDGLPWNCGSGAAPAE
jgi:pimeloyl-ACP methyl ester carboxylesterase